MEEVLFQSHFSCIVKNDDSDQLCADSFYLSTTHEATGHVRVKRRDFIINKVQWELLRSPQGECRGEAEALYGQEAYFKIGPSLKQALGKIGQLQQELIAECVRGIIQAETYLYRERGYETAQNYDEVWEQRYLNSCRYYSNLHRISNKWRDHVGTQVRQQYLFHRNKTCAVTRGDAGQLTVTGYFSDSFHQMGVTMNLAGTKVIGCSGNLLRAPDKVCFEAAAYLNELVGLNVNNAAKKDIAAMIGRAPGCTHLVDIVHDMLKTWRYCHEVDRRCKKRPH